MSPPVPAEGFLKDTFRFCWDTLGNFLRTSEVFPAALDQAQDAYKNETVTFTVRCAKATFAADIANGAKGTASFTGLAANKIRVKRIKMELLAAAARAFDIWFFKKSTFQTVDLDTDSFCAMTLFVAGNGYTCVVATYPQFYYDSGALDQPYECLDGNYQLNTAVVWRDAVAIYDPTAPGTDRITVEVEYEPAA